jgi:hypothetical protein
MTSLNNLRIIRDVGYSLQTEQIGLEKKLCQVLISSPVLIIQQLWAHILCCIHSREGSCCPFPCTEEYTCIMVTSDLYEEGVGETYVAGAASRRAVMTKVEGDVLTS